METRKLGKVGPAVSAVGLGCMGMSDFYGSGATRDDRESLATLRAALEAGITYLDTADFYGSGHNEMLIREALRDSRADALVGVKFGVLRTPAGGFGGLDVRPQAVKNFAAYSLRRLGVEALGLYQPARLDPSVPLEDTVGAIADLIREGKVRCLGLSEANAEQLRRAHRIHPVAAVQVEYSLATRVVEKELLAAARELGTAVVAYGVLSRGLLTGSLTGNYAPSDFRAHAPRFTGANFEANRERVAALEALAEAKGATAAQIALAWALHRGKDVIPLVGTSKRERLAGNLRALDITFTPEEMRGLDEAFPEGAFAGDRYAGPQMQLVVR